MPKRLLIGILLTLMPLTAHAADLGASSQDSSALGPAASSTGTGSSSADAGALQPAGLTPLQSTTGASTGLTAPSSNQLQAPTTPQDAHQLLLNDADGPTHTATEEPVPSDWSWLGFVIPFGLIVTLISMIIRDRRRFRH